MENEKTFTSLQLTQVPQVHVEGGLTAAWQLTGSGLFFYLSELLWSQGAILLQRRDIYVVRLIHFQIVIQRENVTYNL